MLASMPIWSALLGRIAGERLSGRQVVGVGLSVVGIALAFLEPGRMMAGEAMSLVCDGLLLLTGLLGALYGLIAKRVLAVDKPATVTTYAMLFGTLALLPAALVEGIVLAVARLDGRVLGLVLFLGVLGGAAAFLLWTWALSRITPTQVAVYVNLNPIVAALLGIVLLANGAVRCSRSASWPSSPECCWSTGREAAGAEPHGAVDRLQPSVGAYRSMVGATRSSVR
jgi:drug/metabolite transporter (DMT)-like permease